MSGERQVHWGQGAFLSPQHLQAQDLWQQAGRHALHLRLTPFPWGFEMLRVREDALASGVVDVERFALVTRDGERLLARPSAAPCLRNADILNRRRGRRRAPTTCGPSHTASACGGTWSRETDRANQSRDRAPDAGSRPRAGALS